ncbi:MAG: hypothetical protein JRD89_05125 [Deltaproteobacteria bacterium]|nr:hypothetical protein [Deltaproteobacteria bacterium]
MLEIHDYSALSAEEAQRRLVHVAHRILAEQYHEQFFIKDPRPEQYLKYELQAFWEGTIQELHGWTNPVGQAIYNLQKWFSSYFSWFWENYVWGNFQIIMDWFERLWRDAVSYMQLAYLTVLDMQRWLFDLTAQISVAVAEGVRYAASDIAWAVQMRLVPAIQGIFEVYKAFWDKMPYLIDRNWRETQSVSGKLDAVWNDITTQISGAFETLSQQAAALPQAVASGFQNAMLVLKDVFATIWNEVLVPFGGTLAEGVSAVGEQLGNVTITVLNSLYNVLRGFAPLTPDRAGEAAISMLKITGTAAAGLLGMSAVWDLLHPFKDVIPGEIKAMLYDVTGFRTILGGLVGALATAAVIQPSKYMYNYILQPYIPREDDLKRFLWRGLITEQDYREMLRYQGYSKRWVDNFVELTHEIPPPSDLVRFVVREVALMPEDYETPEFFLEAMRKWGYEDYWSRAYWWSHWELPAFGQLQEAYFRDIITRDEFEQYIKWHDYSPTPRPGVSKSDLEIMYELIFRMPDKLDARWMRRWGIIDSDEHKQLLKYEGLHPDWLDRVALAEKMNMLSDERTEIKSAYRSQYLIGIITSPVLQQKLREIFYTPEETEFLIRAAEERYKYEILKDAIDAAKYSYRLGKITLEELTKQLYDLGISAEKVQKIVSVEAARAIEARREAYGESVYIYGRDVAIRRFREGITTQNDLEIELRLLGYSERQIPHLRTVALLERDYDFAMTVLSYVKTAYRKRYIDDVRFIEILRSFGFTDEKIQLELSLIKLAYNIGLSEQEIGA